MRCFPPFFAGLWLCNVLQAWECNYALIANLFCDQQHAFFQLHHFLQLSVQHSRRVLKCRRNGGNKLLIRGFSVAPATLWTRFSQDATHFPEKAPDWRFRNTKQFFSRSTLRVQLWSSSTYQAQNGYTISIDTLRLLTDWIIAFSTLSFEIEI